MLNLEEFIARLKGIIDNEYCWCMESNYGEIKIYVDYGNKVLSDSTLYEIMEADNPREYFNDMLSEWADDYAINYGENELEEDIKNNLTDEEKRFFDENSEEIWDWLHENYYFYYDANDFNNEVRVNLMIDTGDCNYDFTCNNILNYCADGNGDIIYKESSILWLARQFKKSTALRTACKKVFNSDANYINREKDNDPFIESIIQELENLSNHMSTLTFLLKMDLFTYFDLMDAIRNEEELNKSYILEKRKGKGYVKVSKDTMCGLFAPWQGSGSVLEIELPDDLKIPFKCIFDVEIETGKSKYGYSVNDVYGLVSSAWSGTVKEIKPMKIEKEN